MAQYDFNLTVYGHYSTAQNHICISYFVLLVDHGLHTGHP